MEILVLAGSPRDSGNSLALAEAFAQAATEAGHHVAVKRTAALKIGPCRGCDRCWTNGVPCVQKDDMQQLYPLLNLADMVVFASPLYFFGFTAQLKAVIDRFYPLCKGDKKAPFGGKQCALLLCGASEEEADFEGAIQTYEIIADYLDWEDCGELIAPGLSELGDAAKSDWLQAARELAADL